MITSFRTKKVYLQTARFSIAVERNIQIFSQKNSEPTLHDKIQRSSLFYTLQNKEKNSITTIESFTPDNYRKK